MLAMGGGAWLVDGYAMRAERWLCRDWREEELLVLLLLLAKWRPRRAIWAMRGGGFERCGT